MWPGDQREAKEEVLRPKYALKNTLPEDLETSIGLLPTGTIS